MKYKKLSLVSGVILAFFLPIITLAAGIFKINPGSIPQQTNLSITDIVNIILNFIWPIFLGFAVIMFLVAGFFYLLAQGDPKKIQTTNSFVLWGVIGVVMAILAFSIPFIVRNSLGF